MSKYKRVTKKMSRDARNFMHKLMNYIHKKSKNKYKFVHKLVGSTKWNTAILFDNKYDLDYQILLTKKSKQYKVDSFKDATNIHDNFKSIINKYFSEKEIDGIVEDSTSAFTLKFTQRNYSFDIVIIKIYPDNNEIMRRNNGDGTVNHYVWNQLGEYNETYDKFKKLSSSEKEDLIENYILPRKAEEKEKAKRNEEYISSSSIFIMEVNNYVGRKNR